MMMATACDGRYISRVMSCGKIYYVHMRETLRAVLKDLNKIEKKMMANSEGRLCQASVWMPKCRTECR